VFCPRRAGVRGIALEDLAHDGEQLVAHTAGE
jgi:hypothetical protein